MVSVVAFIEGEARFDSPTTVRRTLLLPFKMLPEKQLVQPPNHVVCGMICNSYSWLAMISASSSWIKSESIGCPRTLDKALAADSSLPFLTKYRGDSGRINRPMARMIAQRNWTAIGIR